MLLENFEQRLALSRTEFLMSKYFLKNLIWNENYYKSYAHYDLFSTTHVHEEWSKGSGMTLIRQQPCITLLA